MKENKLEMDFSSLPTTTSRSNMHVQKSQGFCRAEGTLLAMLLNALVASLHRFRA